MNSCESIYSQYVTVKLSIYRIGDIRRMPAGPSSILSAAEMEDGLSPLEIANALTDAPAR
jgi:hypothetical protein